MEYSNILKDISPSKEDEIKIKKASSLVVSALSDAAQSQEVDIVVTLGGSTAKGTFLRGNFDIDIFVRFKSSHVSLSNQLDSLLKDFVHRNNIDIQRVHGSRDYFTFSFQDFFFEVVPVKYVLSHEGVENVTDMSPVHVEWIASHLTPSLQNDIRLAKQFTKAAQVYGAESYINGLSGHVLDILLVYYGSFDNFISGVASWSGITIIDIEDAHTDVFSTLNQSKLISPLIVVDPVDPHRNAAAALSQEKYDLIIAKAKEFQEKPSEEFFKIPSFNKTKLLNEIDDDQLLIICEVFPQTGKKDVVATKILKVFEFIKRHLQLYDFTIYDSDWMYEEKSSHLYFFVKKQDLEEEVLRIGPPLTLNEDVKKFVEVHQNTFEQDGRVCAKVKRDFTSVSDCISHLIASEYVQSRVSSLSCEFFEKE